MKHCKSLILGWLCLCLRSGEMPKYSVFRLHQQAAHKTLEMPLILAKLGDRTVFGSTAPSFCTLVEGKKKSEGRAAQQRQHRSFE